jgi:hypothetical protein
VLFSQDIPPDKLQAWTLDDYDGLRSIQASNRLFTPRSEAPSDPVKELGRDVDPDRKLLEATQGQYFHSDDNKVYYWE